MGMMFSHLSSAEWPCSRGQETYSRRLFACVDVAAARSPVQVPTLRAWRREKAVGISEVERLRDFACCWSCRAFAQRTWGRDPSVTRSSTPSQRRPAPEPGFVTQSRQRERFGDACMDDWFGCPAITSRHAQVASLCSLCW